jgi:hypothetical protein
MLARMSRSEHLPPHQLYKLTTICRSNSWPRWARCRRSRWRWTSYCALVPYSRDCVQGGAFSEARKCNLQKVDNRTQAVGSVLFALFVSVQSPECGGLEIGRELGVLVSVCLFQLLLREVSCIREVRS